MRNLGFRAVCVHWKMRSYSVFCRLLPDTVLNDPVSGRKWFIPQFVQLSGFSAQLWKPCLDSNTWGPTVKLRNSHPAVKISVTLMRSSSEHPASQQTLNCFRNIWTCWWSNAVWPINSQIVGWRMKRCISRWQCFSHRNSRETVIAYG